MNTMQVPPPAAGGIRAVDETKLPPLPDIARRRYLDAAFYEAELTHVWRKSWLLVGHTSDYPQAGSYRQFEFDRAPLVIIRGKDLKLRAFLNSCQHRGATVLKAQEGVTKVMSCQYHGWTYNLEGALIGIPEEQTFPHVKREERHLVELRCELWGGMIFINFDHAAPPLLEWMTPAVVARYGAIFESPMRVVWRKSWDFACNWKLPVEAFREAYHIDTVHKQTVAQMIDCKHAMIELYGNGHDSIIVPYWPRQAMEQGAWDAIPTLSNLKSLPGSDQPEFLANVLEANLFPNVSLAVQSVGFPLFSIWPLAPDRCRVDALWLGVDWGDAPPSPEWDTLTAGSDVVAGEDLANLMSMQVSLAADPDKGVPLATKEIGIYQLHAEIDKLIGAANIPAAWRVPDLLRGFEI